MSRVSLDATLAWSERVAGGLTLEEISGVEPRAHDAARRLASARAEGKLQFLDVPSDAAAVGEAEALGREVARDFDALVVLGIGGSSLGAKALFAALCHPQHNLLARRQGARLFFPDNSDPRTFAALLETLDLKRTAFAAISKSGGTVETMAQLLVVRDRLGADAFRRQVVAVTDPAKGPLRAIAREEGLRSLPVPPGVGGRFSVLTGVGLLPAAAAGVDVRALCAGAGEEAERCGIPSLAENPALLFATVLHLFDRAHGRRVHVFMPYGDALRETAAWFVQLWAESLGKRAPADNEPGVGPTPLGAVGATDQHSLLQLLMGGPQDKVVTFVETRRSPADITIPGGFENLPEAAYLRGRTMAELLAAELRGTEAALAQAGRPTQRITLDALSPESVGALMMMLMAATAMAGTLYGVDPFDQPGVELGKRFASGLLGRPGYESAREEVARMGASDPRWIAGRLLDQPVGVE